MSVYEDASNISRWALDAAEAAAEAGLVQGYNGKLSPQRLLTRAETAVMIKRLLEHAKLI